MQDKSHSGNKCNPKRRIFLKTSLQNVEKLTKKSIFIVNSASLLYMILNCNFNINCYFHYTLKG